MQGFSHEQKEQHIRKLVGDDDLANKVIDHIKISKSLYCFCRIPAMCTIMATVLKVSDFAHEHPLLLREETSVHGVPMFCFAHISVLEYIYALVKLNEETSKGPIDDYLACLQETIDDMAHDFNGKYDMCLRFFFGLLKERGQLQISDPLFAHYKKEMLHNFFDYVCVLLIHCVREFNSQALLHDVIKYHVTGLPPIPILLEFWVEVMLMIMNVEGLKEKFEMELSGRCDEKVLRSLPEIFKSKKAMLRFSNLSDACCPALASVLSAKESFMSELDLGFNSITDRGVESLVLGLSDQDCNLNCNNIGDVGLKHLAGGLESPKCKLDTLKLSQCNIKREGGFHLASALQKNPGYLKWLDLSINKIGNKAANELFTKFDISRLTKLEIYCCGLTEKSFQRIYDAIQSKNTVLVELNLSNNDLKDAAADLIFSSLNCSRIEKLMLSRCGLTEQGCFFLSKSLPFVVAFACKELEQLGESTVEVKRLRELDLSMNKLGDHGVVHLLIGITNPFTRLRKLNLIECDLTCDCCSEVASYLLSSQCGLLELDLSSNNIQDMGIKKLCCQKLWPHSKCASFLHTALKTNRHLTQLFLMGNTLDDNGINVLLEMTKSTAYKLKTVE
ncbi:hypothetical protein WMY93_007111 [Mugilogobius chulae]|uniref:Uncharacterized protein n=1 Tax=Mugilogobius chulae TaxID=88201 RepID=A0AAW0PY25_9GOBI